MANTNASYQEALEYLYTLQKFGIKFGLSKTSNLLKSLSNPQNGQKYIHIAGTNGKGSVAAICASIFIEAGLRVGVYSSPHLVRFTERFRINNNEITQEKVIALIDELKNVIDKSEPPTFFEAATAMAIAYFAREKTDIAIMETGMGGRLDATNVISPILCVITNISMEHQFYLGSRLSDIAGEKGGIIKNGVDVITGAAQPGVLNVFKSICEKKRAPLLQVGKDIRYRLTDSGFHYYGIKHRLNRLELGLKGHFQGRNAAIALAVVEVLKEKGVEISNNDIREGLKNVSWPGRMHVLGRRPDILLDGAHNPAAIRVLSASIKTDFKYKRLILVLGVMEDKEIGQILKGIVPLSDYVIYTRPVYPRAADPEDLMAEAAFLKKPGEAIHCLTDALDRAMEIAGPKDLIVVCGSLFTVGEAMTYFDSETYMPDNV